MSLELNEEIDIKSETIEEHDFMSSEIDIKSETYEEQDNEFESNVTSGNSITLSGNETDNKIGVDRVEIGGEVDPVEIGGDVETSLTKPVFGKRLACEICHKTFRKRHRLGEHLRSEHSIDNVKPFIQIVTKCFVCNKNFAEQSTYKVHLLSHADVLHSLFSSEKKDSYTYACKICGCVLRSKTKHVQHIKTVHLRLQEYKCNFCSTHCTNENGLIKHFIIKHSEFEPMSCEVCSYKFKEKGRLKRHLLKKHKLDENSVARLLTAQSACKSSLFCKVCDIKFDSRLDINHHIRCVHLSLDKIKCPACQKDFTCIVKIIDHVHSHSVTKKKQDNHLESNGTFGQVKKLIRNETDNKTDVDPVEIGDDVASTSLVKNSVSDNSVNCKICHKLVRPKNHLHKHLKYEHNIKGFEHCIIERLTKCFICNKTFDTRSFMVHLLSHTEILHPLFSGEKIDATTFVCKICGITLNSNAKIVQHVKSFHLGLKEYKCKDCSLYFIKKFMLIKHFIFLHCEYGSYACMLCNSKNFTKVNLKTHLLMTHKLDENSNARLMPATKKLCKSPLNCIVCDIEFQSRDDFYQHISDIHVIINQIKCPVCHKDFTCIFTIISHLVNHCGKNQEQRIEFESNGASGDHATLSGNETDIKIELNPVEIGGEVVTTSVLKNSTPDDYFACEICSEMFNERPSLVLHLREYHKEVQPCIKCFVCSETIETQERLIAHLQRHAAILHPLFINVKTDSGTFSCKICEAKEKGMDEVIQHIKSDHLGLKEYKCKVCNTYFTHKISLMDHFISQHSFVEPFTCEHCSYKFFLRSSLKRHLLEKHKLNESSVAGLLPASSICKPPLTCKVCEIEFKSLLVFHQHISALHAGLDKINCLSCQKDFTCIATLIIHLHDQCGKKQPFSCGMCEERFSTENDRGTHLVNFHNKSPDGSSGSSRYECDTCKKVFTTTDPLKDHNIDNYNSNSFSCFKCNKCDMFGSYNNLKEHNYCSYPSEDSSVICSVCKETFSSVKSLKIHSANMHENTFETSQFDNTELLVSPDTNIGIVRCEICKQDFDNPTSLMDHFIKIHKNGKKQTSPQQNRRERQKVSQREHRTAEYLKNRLGSSPVKLQLQQAMEVRKVRPDCNSTGNCQAEIGITKVKPCCVLLDRGEVTRYPDRVDKREEGTVGSSPIEDLPPPLATPPVRVYPSYPCGRVRVTSDRLLSAATSNMGLVCNNIRPRINVESEQLCVVNSGDVEVSANNCIQNTNLASQQLGNFEEMYIKSEPFFF